MPTYASRVRQSRTRRIHAGTCQHECRPTASAAVGM